MDTGAPRFKLNTQVVGEAAEWLVELSCGHADFETRRRFDGWLRASPEHIRAYLEILLTWRDAGLVDVGRQLNVDSLIRLAREGGNVVAFGGEANSRTALAPLPNGRRRVTKYRAVAAAAAVAVLTLIAAATGRWYESSRYSTYATAAGEQRSIMLPDGSTIELDSMARIRVRYSAHERDIDLLKGEALFEDTKDARRPFVVFSGPVRVVAIGTQFNVARDPEGTTVTVVEGRVAVVRTGTRPTRMPQPARGGPPQFLLSAGEQTTVTADAISTPRLVDIAVAMAWVQRHLLFDSTPLPQVVQRFNRYNARKLVVADPRLDAFLVSGVFTSTDPDSLLNFLRAQPGVRVQSEPNEVVISLR